MARAGGISNPVNVGIAVQADWENREFISNISLNVRRLFEFLLQFGARQFLLLSLSQLDPVVSSVISFQHDQFFDHCSIRISSRTDLCLLHRIAMVDTRNQD
jgi:hypothetical protein